MKQVLTFLTVLFFSLSSLAQSGTELEFSRTINETFTSQSVTLGPVPSGKIWKLVGYVGPVKFALNGSAPVLYLGDGGSTGSPRDHLPVFFNESDIIAFSTYMTSDRGYVSIIEYTVIP